MATFTHFTDNLLFSIITECKVYPGIPVESIKTEKDLPPSFDAVNVLWDTGSEVTLINPRVVKQLNLKSFSYTELDGIGGSETNKTYIIHIKLPTGDYAFNVEAIETANTGEYDVVIGMDIISFGDFALTNKNNKSMFSFRFPSECHIDFKCL